MTQPTIFPPYPLPSIPSSSSIGIWYSTRRGPVRILAAYPVACKVRVYRLCDGHEVELANSLLGATMTAIAAVEMEANRRALVTAGKKRLVVVAAKA